MSIVNPQVQDSKVSDILQASTTVASLAVAIAVFLPSLSKLVTLNIGSLQLPILRPILLFCGLCALMSSFSSIRQLSRELKTSVVPGTNLGWLLFALVLFAITYILVVASL
jgi:hypothetical protein